MLKYLLIAGLALLMPACQPAKPVAPPPVIRSQTINGVTSWEACMPSITVVKPAP